MAAVAHGLQNAGQHVVHDHGDRSCKISAEILKRERHDLFRRAHPAQNLRGEHQADQGDDGAGNKADQQGIVYGLVDLFALLCTEMTCNDDACAQRQAVEKADNQKNQVAR